MSGSERKTGLQENGAGDGVALPDNFETVRVLGEGAMARVILARDTALKRLVAIKMLRPELAEDLTCRRRFEREAQAAARLSDERVTTIYSVGRLPNDDPYIVMQYVDGRNLADLLSAHGPLSIDDTIALLARLAGALAAAHEQGIVHRDVKPANVLIDSQSGAATLTDFGVAAIMESGSDAVTRLTRENETFGDARYMSPEQLRGEPLTGQSDIYSLGIIGYELLAGRGPFDDPEIRNVAAAHLRRPPPDPAALRDGVPAALSETLQRCLAKQPERRPRAADIPEMLRRTAAEAAGKEPIGAFAGFLRELKQRKVYRAAAAYVAFSFVVLQAADLLLPAFTRSGLPYRVTVITCLAGFPLAIVLAWIYELRDGHLVRTREEEGALFASATPLQRAALKWLGLTLSFGLVLVVAWVLLGT